MASRCPDVRARWIAAMIGRLVRIYVTLLLRGNPFVLVPTVVGVVALALGPFSEALSEQDPWALGLAAVFVLGIALVVVIAIIDRRNESGKGKKRPPSKAARR